MTETTIPYAEMRLLQIAGQKRPYQNLEAWEVFALEPPALAEANQMIIAAIKEEALLGCEKNGWLLRNVAGSRELPVWWSLSDTGREALQNAK